LWSAVMGLEVLEDGEADAEASDVGN
jgi:hypothetical protein